MVKKSGFSDFRSILLSVAIRGVFMRMLIFSILVLFLFFGCQASEPGESFISDTDKSDKNSDDDPKYLIEYKGLRFYSKSLNPSSYTLEKIDDDFFNSLSYEKKSIVADKLLTTLFFGYPQPVLEQKIQNGDFISSLFAQLRRKKNDIDAVESTIRDKEKFYHSSSTNDEVNHILSRFFVLKELDSYFLANWISYILTQTILFSPAYELESSHEPNTQRVYNSLVRNIEDETTISYSGYLHMISSDNWRRFRSPEDNGREMMEIYALLFDDALVPVAAKALQNWKLDRDNDTLVIGLNENTKPLKLFDTTIKNGDDFYRELAKSKLFQKGVVTRLVDFFFTTFKKDQKEKVVGSILKSNPNRWEDIFLQIIFSKEYLLNCDRPKSAEELFYSLTKKMEYKYFKYSFYRFAKALENMHQASMKYKLGKLTRVPLDTLSFINYHKFIREEVLCKGANPDKYDNYKDWDSYGFTLAFISQERFSLYQDDPKGSLKNFVNYLFKSLLQREASSLELNLFESHMIVQKKDSFSYSAGLNLLKSSGRMNAAILIMDYISRLSSLYRFEKVIS